MKNNKGPKEIKNKAIRQNFTFVTKIDVTMIDEEKRIFIGNVIWSYKDGNFDRIGKLFLHKKVEGLIEGLQLGINYLYCNIKVIDCKDYYNEIQSRYEVIDINNKESDLYNKYGGSIDLGNSLPLITLELK